MLDVTIVYPQGTPTFWDFMSGKVKHVIVRIKELKIPEKYMQGDNQNDPKFRAEFHKWVSQIWKEKDELIEQLLETKNSSNEGSAYCQR